MHNWAGSSAATYHKADYAAWRAVPSSRWRIAGATGVAATTPLGRDDARQTFDTG
jgi:hypothetical protein